MISVIIVNHNCGEHIQRCLESLTCRDGELEVLLVDNASTDGSLELVKQHFPRVRILEQEGLIEPSPQGAVTTENVTKTIPMLKLKLKEMNGIIDEIIKTFD